MNKRGGGDALGLEWGQRERTHLPQIQQAGCTGYCCEITECFPRQVGKGQEEEEKEKAASLIRPFQILTILSQIVHLDNLRDKTKGS